MASLDEISIRKKFFFRLASDVKEYERTNTLTNDLVKLLTVNKADIYTFIERRWCTPIINPPKNWLKTQDNIALATVYTYEEWISQVGKKTRNMIRKAEKTGIKTQPVEPSEKLAEGIWEIYNETPIRQGRPFPHYGETLEKVRNTVFCPSNGIFIAAHLGDKLVGFIHLLFGDQIAIISQILAMQKYKDKAVNNVLIAKAIEICAQRKTQQVMYGRIGNHPSLDKFKENNGFTKYPLTRYFIALTRKGKFAVALGLQRELKDRLPQWFKLRMISVYNWISKTKFSLKH